MVVFDHGFGHGRIDLDSAGFTVAAIDEAAGGEASLQHERIAWDESWSHRGFVEHHAQVEDGFTIGAAQGFVAGFDVAVIQAIARRTGPIQIPRYPCK